MEQRIESLESRVGAVEGRVAILETDRMTRAEIEELIDSRFDELLESLEQAIDRRMIYYGRRVLVLVATPALGLVFNLIQGWLT